MPRLPCAASWLLACALALCAPAPAADLAQARQEAAIESNLLLLEVRLEQALLSDGINAYQLGDQVFLPLGELCQLLTIAIRSQPALGQAGGYVLSEERAFSLNLAALSVKIGDASEKLEPSLFQLRADDIYVASGALARWLPVDLDLDLASLTLRVRPRETLPLQARLERQNRARLGAARAGVYVDPGFPRLATPYRMLAAPMIDQTFGVDMRRGLGRADLDAAYTAYMTADLLYMEAALYVNSSKQQPTPVWRLTLARHDPDAGLLGPLRARLVALGSVNAPGVANIAQSSPSGNGVTLSNRPLSQPTSFDRHSLQGDLPAGWDVELYFNEALVAVQQSRADGKYTFDDQALQYGPNDFRLVFHGPLGQLRVERQSFLLEQASIAPGQLYYHLTGQRDTDGQRCALAQFEWGLDQHFTAAGGLATLQLAGLQQQYANLALRTFWPAFIISADLAKQERAGTLAELALKTRLGPFAIGLSHARANDFSSDIFLPGGDPVRASDSVRVDGAVQLGLLTRVPLALELKRDTLASGAENIAFTARAATYRYGTALSNTVRWQSFDRAILASGALQASRRVAGVGVSAQLEYGIAPRASLSSAALSLNRSLADGYLLNLAAGRAFPDRHGWYGTSLSKSLGSVGFNVGASYSSQGQLALHMQLFLGAGREPRQGAWQSDAQPMASSGAASIRVFLDRNQNGIMDPGEEAIQGVGFTVNGGAHPARTDAAGIAYLKRLPANQNVDLGIDASTLEDPQWSPRQKGVRLVPRPGKVGEFDFAVSLTGEIDGMAYFLDQNGKRGIGDLQLELVGAKGIVVARATSASDGYYIVPAVPPGTYLLRVAPAQLKRLKLSDTGMRPLTMGQDGAFLNGVELLVIPAWETQYKSD